MTSLRPITSELADYAEATTFDALPRTVREESIRAFLNWVGCALGGCREEVTIRSLDATMQTFGPAQSTLIGQGLRADMESAAFVNCVASSALAFDDTHIATVTHPTGPVASPLFAFAETKQISGKEFLNALALGIEVQCRLSNSLLLPPADGNVSLYITGQTGPVGGAIALGRVMGFDKRRLQAAIGFAATQGAGFRATHGAMSGLVVPGLASRAGFFAAQLAAADVECMDDTLENPKGFLAVHARGADPNHAIDGLGSTHEILSNTYKPYPAGIVVQPAIDACRALLEQIQEEEVKSVSLWVHPLTMTLADRRHPKDGIEAQVSLYHWAAAVILRQVWGPEVNQDGPIKDTKIAKFRDKITSIADPTLKRDQARAEAQLKDGRVITSYVDAARGSLTRKMNDEELDQKFMGQAMGILGQQQSEHLLNALRSLDEVDDVGAVISTLLKHP